MKGYIPSTLFAAVAALSVHCAPEPAPHARAAILQALPMSSFAGRFTDGDTFVSVVMAGDVVRAYVCDGRSGHWFEGTALRLPALLRAADGATLLLRLEGDGLSGAMRRASGQEMAFRAPRTQESALFRAVANSGEQRFVGGWIVLPDGAQRGTVFNGQRSFSSQLALAGERAVVLVSGEDRDASRRLEPVRFTPEALLGRTPNRQQFNIVGLGDSFAAGEGAPEDAGAHGSDGVVDEPGERSEVWDVRATTRPGPSPMAVARRSPAGAMPTAQQPSEARLAEMCHRSGVNGTRVAAANLRDEWPNAGVHVESFACSGARVRHLLRNGVGEPYEGPGGPDQMIEGNGSAWLNRPQLEQVQIHERSSGRDTHAITLSIGGNDLHFPDIVSSCILDPDCSDLIPVLIPALGVAVPPRTLLDRGQFGHGDQPPIRDKYRLLAAQLDDFVPRNRVFMLDVPMLVERPATPNSATIVPCDFVDPLGDGFATIFGDEIPFIRHEVIPRVRQVFNAARADNRDDARGGAWSMVSGHVEPSRRHGLCTGAASWFGTRATGLRDQGQDIDGGLTGAICHPNVAAHRDGYGPAIADALRPVLRAHVRPATPTRLRVVAQVLDGPITVRWDDRATTETEYRVLVTPTNDAGTMDTGRTITSTLPGANAPTEFVIGTARHAAFRVEVRACHVGTGVAECSESNPQILVANFHPSAVPADLSVAHELCNTACTTPQMRWSAVNDPAHVYYEAEVDGVPIATADTFLQVGTANRFRVRSCNFLACGAYALPVEGPRRFDVRAANAPMLQQLCRGHLAAPPVPGGDPGGVCRNVEARR